MENKKDCLDFLHEKVTSILSLSHIKRSDFYSIFSREFKINDEWKIEHLNHISKSENLWEDYFDSKDEYLAINENSCKEIDSFINACNIEGVYKDSGLYFPNVKVSNISFFNDYNEMEDCCLSDYDNLNDLFKKAYYLSKIGKLAESYKLYTAVLKLSKEHKDWAIYYLSQVNRYHLYRKIDSARTYYYQPISIMSFGKIVLIDEKFYHQMSLEMSHCNIETQFNELPYFFRSNYGFLDRFSEKKLFF